MKRKSGLFFTLIAVAVVLGFSSSAVLGVCLPNKRAANVGRPFFEDATYIDFGDRNDGCVLGTCQDFIGRFWQTDLAAGANEGTYGPDQWMSGEFGDGFFYFLIEMGAAGVEGCPVGCATVYVEDQQSDTFVVWTHDEGPRAVAGNDYDFTDVIGGFASFAAVNSPRPVVSSSSRSATDVTVNFNVRDISAGIVTDACGGAVESVEVFQLQGAKGGASSLLTVDGWLTTGNAFGVAGGSGSVVLDCTDTTQNWYLATGLQISGVTRFVSTPVEVECDPNLADPGRNFRTIERPGTGEPREIRATPRRR